MRMTKYWCRSVILGVSTMLCGGGTPAEAARPAPSPHTAGHAHVHPTEGPHHGVLIELGKEDYHAELVRDEAAETVTVYVLDAAAKDAVPVEARQLTLNLLVEGKPQQFQLAARRQPTDPEGSCSAFSAHSGPLCTALGVKGTTGRLNVQIKGRMFVGRVEPHSHAPAR